MNPSQTVVVQTIGKAAAKTFVQTFIVTAAPLLLAWAASAQLALQNTQNGGSIDIDFRPLMAIAISALLAACAALISAAWNWAKGPTTTTPVVVPPPAVIDK